MRWVIQVEASHQGIRTLASTCGKWLEVHVRFREPEWHLWRTKGAIFIGPIVVYTHPSHPLAPWEHRRVF